MGTMAENRVPPIPKELLDYLEGAFRFRPPATSKFTKAEVAFQAGAASVVTHLKHHFDRQNRPVIPTQP